MWGLNVIDICQFVLLIYTNLSGILRLHFYFPNSVLSYHVHLPRLSYVKQVVSYILATEQEQ